MNNNMSISECSSGCESGWTMYLDQSSNSTEYRGKRTDVYPSEKNPGAEGGGDEDLSMVSDASSGPRQFHEEEDEDMFFDDSRYFSEQRKQKKKIKENRGMKQQKNSNLDDTASSPVLSISNKDQASMEHVMGFSKEFKGKTALQKHFGFLKPSATGKAASEKSGCLQGGKWQ